MKPSERRAAMKAEMSQRAAESYNSKDDSGKFKSIFIKDKLGNTPRWKCSEDEHFLNIIPFIAGKNHPTVAEGKPAYFLDIWVHNKVGINEDSYVCMARSYNKPCAICDHQNELRKMDDYDEKYVKSLNPSRRAVYNIECLDSDKEIKKKVQYWDASHFSIEKEIAELAKKPRSGGFITFADPDDGKTLFFRRTGSGQNNTKYSAFKFEDRTEPISDEILDLALCLDDCIHLPSYDEVKNAFFGNTIDEEDPRVREENAVDADLETKEPIETNSRVRRSSQAAPEEKKVEEKSFECPGNAPDDFGTFDACDKCPDVAECEAEFNKMEQEKLEEQERLAKEAEKEKEAPVSGIAARRARASAGEAEKKEEPAQTEEVTRRVRRRPGQD